MIIVVEEYGINLEECVEVFPLLKYIDSSIFIFNFKLHTCDH